MRQVGTIVLAAADCETLNLAGRSPTRWSEECARNAGFASDLPADGVDEAVSAHQHLLVLDPRWPLLLPESVERLVSRHLETGSEATFLTSGEAVEHGASRVCAGCFSTAWLAAAGASDRSLESLARLSVKNPTAISVAPLTNLDECLRLDSMVEAATAERLIRERINTRAMLSGVRLIDPATTYIDADVTIEPESTIGPNTHLRGTTRIARGCVIGPNAIIEDSSIGAGSTILGATVERSTVAANVRIGLHSHIRDGAEIEEGAEIGNYAEIKNSRIGPRTRMHHFGYIGDADIGAGVNIGAGAITVNYDGVNKHRTTVGDAAFIGSDTLLIAPVTVGKNAATAAGAVVTKAVPDGMLALGVPATLRERPSPPPNTTVGTDGSDQK